MNDPILVTGATGNVGREVTRAFKQAGIPFRAAVSDPERAAPALDGAASRTRLDFTRPETFQPALDGVRGVFLLRPPAIADVKPTLCAFIDEAKRSGVEQVVFLSVSGAEKNPLLPHRKVEDHLQQSGMAWTLLRPGFFAQNLADAYREDIRQDDRIHVPAGRGSASFVDLRDVAEVAVMAFRDPACRNRALTLTGGEPVSFEAAAAMLSRALGRRIRYEPASIAGYVQHLRARGQPMGQVAVITLLHVLFRVGQGSAVDPTLGQLLGRAPTTLETYIQDHRALWQQGPADPSGLSTAGAR